MLRYLILASSLLVSTCTASAPAYAQQPKCGPHADIIKKLGDKYQAVPAAIGVLSNGNVMEILVSPSGSFIVLMVRPDGAACLVGAGENFESITPKPTGPLA